MNKVDYNKLMKEQIKGIKALKQKPTLLLHVCCAPCSTTCIERLKDVFDITVFFYNPNMDSLDEYRKRGEEAERISDIFGVKSIVCPFDQNEFYKIAKGKEDYPEGGERCFSCYKLRLNQTALYAKREGYDYFATSLTLSPLKRAEKLNEIGKELEKAHGVKYLFSDFKKEGGYLRSIELSKEFGLYRQNYCGCVYSKRLQP